jgi:hypothetical protein
MTWIGRADDLAASLKVDRIIADAEDHRLEAVG